MTESLILEIERFSSNLLHVFEVCAIERFYDFFVFIEKALVRNFADDNSLSLFSASIKDLVKSLELESKAAIGSFSINNMILNLDKFEVMIVDKRKRDHSNESLDINN